MLKNNKSTVLDISKFVETYVEKSEKYKPGKRYNIEVVQFAGGKDDDATKLHSIFESAILKLKETARFGDVTYRYEVVDAIPSIEGDRGSKPLSATIVRECARKCFHGAAAAADPITTGLICLQTAHSFYVTGPDFDIRPLYMEIVIDPTGTPYPIKKPVKSAQSESMRAEPPYPTGSKGGSRRKIKNLRYKRTIRKKIDRHQRRR